MLEHNGVYSFDRLKDLSKRKKMRTITYRNIGNGILAAKDEYNSVEFRESHTRIYLVGVKEEEERYMTGTIFSYSTNSISRIYLDKKRDIISYRDVQIFDGFRNIWVKEVVTKFVYPFGKTNICSTKLQIVKNKTMLEEILFGKEEDIFVIEYGLILVD